MRPTFLWNVLQPSDTLRQGWQSSCRHGNSSYLSSYLSLVYTSSSQVFCSSIAVISSCVGRVRSLTRPVACTKQHHGVGGVLCPWSAVACWLLESVKPLPGSEHMGLHPETAACRIQVQLSLCQLQEEGLQHCWPH